MDIMLITINRGKLHNYLDKIMDYLNQGEVKIIMYQYICCMLNGTPGIYKNRVGISTPAPSNLYEARSEGVVLLSDKDRHKYHSITT